MNLKPTAPNVHQQTFTTTRVQRAALNGHAGAVVWLTGLSGAGKSTIANALDTALHQHGVRSYVLDGDNLRQGLCKDLGFSDADRAENIRRIAEVAGLMMDAGIVVITAFISPFQKERAMARALIGSQQFLEVYVATPLTLCQARDPKGLYEKVRRGAITNMTGIHSAYEPPEEPDVCIDTGLSNPVEAATQIYQVMQHQQILSIKRT